MADAYLKIYQLVVAGRGPRGAFRPYLYQTVRTVAVDQLRSRERAVGELDQALELVEAGPDDEARFDFDAVRQAFAALDERWQAALWYTEVEGLPPRKAAPLLGLSANATAVLAKRAREGLRSAWVEAHANNELAEAECRGVLAQLQRYQRGKLAAGARREVEAHLADCVSCTAVAADFSEMNRRLGLILGGAILGGVGLGPLLAQFGLGSGTAYAAALAGGAVKTLAAGTAGSAGSTAAVSGAGAASASIGGAAAAAAGATGAATLGASVGAGAALIGTFSAATVTVGAVVLTASAALTPAATPPDAAFSTASAEHLVSAEYAAPTAQPNRRGGAEPAESDRNARQGRQDGQDQRDHRDGQDRQDQRDRKLEKQVNSNADQHRREPKPEKPLSKPEVKDPKAEKPHPRPHDSSTGQKKPKSAPSPPSTDRGNGSTRDPRRAS